MRRKQVYFKVIKENNIELAFKTLDYMRAYPTNFEKLTEHTEVIVKLDYCIDKSLHETEYITNMQGELKKQYRATTVLYLGEKTKEKQLKS